MTPNIKLCFTINLTITGLDVREPIFRHYHEIENSSQHREAEQHGMPLVTKSFHDEPRYWVTLNFPDLPSIYCLDEKHGRYKGLPLEKAIEPLEKQHHNHIRISWGHEHFVTAIWDGIRVLEFEKSYQRLKEILGEKFPEDPQWKAYGPTPETLEEIARALK